MYLDLNEVEIIHNDKEHNLIVIKSHTKSTPEEQKERLARYVAKLMEWGMEEKQNKKK